MPRSAACKLETREHWWCNSSLSPEACKPSGANGENPSPREGEAGRQEAKSGKFFLSLYFSVLVLSGLDDANPHWGRLSALLRPPIQILLSYGNTSQTHLEITFNLSTPRPSPVDT